jgi:hypothetical protein
MEVKNGKVQDKGESHEMNENDKTDLKDFQKSSSQNFSNMEELKLMEFNQTIKLNVDFHLSFNILILGMFGVGKTKTLNFICDNFTKEKNSLNNIYIPTIGTDLQIKKFRIDEKIIKINFYDIGKFDFDLNHTQMIEYFNLAHACIYVIDSQKEESISLVEKFTSLNPNNDQMVNYLILNKNLQNPNSSTPDTVTKETKRIKNMLNCEHCHFNKCFQSSIVEKNSYKNFFNFMLNDCIDFFKGEDRGKLYKEKNKLDNKNIFFRYRKSRKNTKCWC